MAPIGRPVLVKNGKEALMTSSAIKQETVLFRIPTLKPFVSFPHDAMHDVMNMSKNITELFKGACTEFNRIG